MTSTKALQILKMDATCALVSDALDALGVPDRILPHDIVPLDRDSLVVGRVFPVRAEPVTKPPEAPYANLLRALESIDSGSVFVLSTDRAENVAVWGELLSIACQSAEVEGTLTDGLVRDSSRIRQLGYPVFARGTTPHDIHGRLEVTNFGSPITLDGVTLRPKDVVVGDEDGVAIIPQEKVNDVIELLQDKKGAEGEFRKAVQSGFSASEAYDRYEVL